MRINSIEDLPEQHRAQVVQQLNSRPKGRSPLLAPLERDEQAAVIAWADAHPVACVIYANVNGQYRNGQRPEPGLRAGIPDLFLPVPAGPYHGMHIEMKRTVNGVVSDAQTHWIETLTGLGYYVVVCYGAKQAIEEIEGYLAQITEVAL